MMDDHDLTRKIMQAFIKDMPIQLRALKRGLPSGEAPEIRRLLHSMKGASSNVCGLRFNLLVAELETCAKNGDIETVTRRLSELLQQFLQLKEAIDAEL
jgi:HPt (histidine-containing phosphotransfer) domain-containing protein